MSDWIEWNGGECPLPPGTWVEVCLRDLGRARQAPARFLRWSWYGLKEEPDDIIFYRVLSKANKTEEPKPNGWIEHIPWYRHDGGPMPCPPEIVVETCPYMGRNSSAFNLAKELRWYEVRYWRPADNRYEFKFDGDRLVSYRLKETKHD